MTPQAATRNQGNLYWVIVNEILWHNEIVNYILNNYQILDYSHKWNAKLQGEDLKQNKNYKNNAGYIISYMLSHQVLKHWMNM